MNENEVPRLHLPSNKIMQVQGMFFDLDGVLYDAEPYKFVSYMLGAMKNKVPLSVLQENGWLYGIYANECIGKSREDNSGNQVKKLQEKGYLKGFTWEKYFDERKIFYSKIEENIPLIKENVEFLKETRKKYNNLLMTIATRSKPDVVKKTLAKDSLDGKPLYDWVEIASVSDKNKQKYSESVRLTNARGIELENCVAIEDTIEGLLEAKNYGLFTIITPSDFTKMHDFYGAGADLVLENLLQLSVC